MFTYTAPYTVEDGVVYPDCDGEPMSDNTLQWEWMVKIVCELREQFKGQQVFVAGNLMWYPVKGKPKICAAPDALVVFDRPSGYRGSYIQWREDNRPMQVVFEVLSESNTPGVMSLKFEFYQRYGVEEYYVIDPEGKRVTGYTRHENRLVPVPNMQGYRSKLLGIRFEMTDVDLLIFTPGGREFMIQEDRVAELTEEMQLLSEVAERERQRAEDEAERAELYAKREEQLTARAERDRRRAEAEAKRAEAFAAKLRELGVNPDDLLKTGE